MDKKLHFLHVILYALCAVAALWQHGHPVFTLVVLFSLAVAGITAPMMFNSDDIWKHLFVLLFPLGAGVWIFYRFSSKSPSDIYIVEALAIAGICFFFNLHPKEKGYRLLICTVLLIYGAVIPRELFFYVSIPILIFVFPLLYLSRTDALSKNPANLTKPVISRYELRYLILHVCIVVVLASYLFTMFPTRKESGTGAISTSFFTNNQPTPMLKEWFIPKRVVKSKTGEIIQSGLDNPEERKDAGEIASFDSTDPSIEIGQGGGAPPGEDLVFRVVSKIKLYWLCALYDYYDGEKWIATERVRKQQLRKLSNFAMNYSHTNQAFNIEKWNSAVLPAAFINSNFHFQDHSIYKKLEKTFYNAKFADLKSCPNTPFNYSTSTYIINSSVPLKKGASLWREKIRASYYVRLPEKKVSSRLKEIALAITGQCSDDYEKAIAIRDYLRNKFKYNLFSDKVPENKEAVDYFIFELKQGHCEYFAAAMAVLARLNNLPARVATGYSPGDYNILHSYFEVREYHAHAWTQIYIKNKGWLTFDAVPPGEIISRTTPVLMGIFKDPFGDEWQITPPEITEHTQKTTQIEYPKNTSSNRTFAGVKIPEKSEFYDIIMKIPSTKQELKTSFEDMKKNILSKDEKKSGLGKLIVDFKNSLNSMINKFKTSWILLIAVLKGKTGIMAGALVIFFVLCYFLFPYIRKFISLKFKKLNCRKMIIQAEKITQSNPALCLKLCYLAIRDSLDLAGFQRKNNMELFDYGASLEAVNPQFSKDVLMVFFLYSKMTYSKQPATAIDSDKAFKKLSDIREFLLHSTS